MTSSFSDDIDFLISLMHEGEYWDFKKQWHDDAIELLHDIICMANCLICGDKYIIIGVDEEKKYKVCGVKKTDSNRKDTNQLNNFLRNGSFVGGIRPLVRVENIFINNRPVDVIVIEDSSNTPFVLAEDCHFKNNPKKYLRQGNIYTRIGDSNTPIDKTADNDKVENLWRKRFRIFATPLEKFLYYLRDWDGWEKTAIDKESEDGVIVSYYYKYAPEYTINLVFRNEPSMLSDFLCKMWPESTNYDSAYLKVYDSIVKKIHFADIDGFRYKAIMPNYYSIAIDRSQIQYLFMTYLIDGEMPSLLRKFILNKERLPSFSDYDTEWLEHVIVFSSQEEKDDFISYIKNNGQEFLKLANDAECPFTVDEQWTDRDSRYWIETKILRNAYFEWQKTVQK